MLIEYLRDKDNNRIGVLIAEKFEKEGGGDESLPYFSIGWSKFNAKKERGRFDREKALKIALERAKKCTLDKYERANAYLCPYGGESPEFENEYNNLSKISLWQKKDEHYSEEDNPHFLPPLIIDGILKMAVRASFYYKGVSMDTPLLTFIERVTN